VTARGDGEPADKAGDVVVGAVLIGFYSTLGYAVCGIIRSVLGRSGVPLSPLAAYAVLVVLAVALFRVEARLQLRQDWDAVKGRWFKFGAGFLTLVQVAPIILGLTFPWAVFVGLSPAVSGWLCVVPLGLLFGRVYWLIRHPPHSTNA
jgi:hypothetical protein